MPLDITDGELRDRNDRHAQRVLRLWQQALEEVQAILAEARDEGRTGYTVEFMREIERSIREVTEEAGDDMLTLMREAGAAEAAAIQTEFAGVFGRPPLAAFAGVSEELIAILEDEMERTAEETVGRANTVGTTLSDSLRRLQLETVILGELKAESIEERAARIEKALHDGLVELPEKWRGSVESYAEMVARTTLAEASRALTMAQAQAAGIEIFQVPVVGAVDACGAFEGRLVSVDGTGEGVSMSLAELYALRPLIFHPNCRHRLQPWVRELAPVVSLRAIEIANQEPFPDINGLKRMNNEANRLRRQQEEEGGSILRDRENELARIRLGRAA